MKNNNLISKILIVFFLTTSLAACNSKQASEDAKKSSEKSSIIISQYRQFHANQKSLKQLNQDNQTDKSTLSSLRAVNKSTQASIGELDQQIQELTAETKSTIAAMNQSNKTSQSKPNQTNTSQTSTSPATSQTSTSQLAMLNYDSEQEIAIDHNDPHFTNAELATDKGAWEHYTDLDQLNRAIDANALLNQTLMPTAKRTELTWDPTGWHNKRTQHGWLYNRSHLIGFQLSGENNNPKNLITGTQSLNNPIMLAHEMDIATYLKSSSANYVRYEVRPIYRGNELVARGVQMRAQSIGSNAIRLNVYIFNIEDGYTINYSNGTSVAQ